MKGMDDIISIYYSSQCCRWTPITKGSSVTVNIVFYCCDHHWRMHAMNIASGMIVPNCISISQYWFLPYTWTEAIISFSTAGIYTIWTVFKNIWKARLHFSSSPFSLLNYDGYSKIIIVERSKQLPADNNFFVHMRPEEINTVDNSPISVCRMSYQLVEIQFQYLLYKICFWLVLVP